MKKANDPSLVNVVKEISAWLIALIVIIPFLVVVVNALKTTNEAYSMSLTLPDSIRWENFKKVWEIGNIPRAYFNSLFMSVTTVIISTFCASMCSFVIARKKSKLNRAIYVYFALGLMFPVSMVSIVKITRLLGVYNSQLGVILVFVSLVMPLSVFLYYGFIGSIPKELDEAAIVDGAGPFRLFFQIIFPLLKPVTVTVIMINFLNAWNDFTVPLYLLPDPDKAVIVQQVYNFYGTFTASWNLVSVTILFAIVPTLIVYIFGQKYIISGMAAGAVKG